MLSHCIIQGPLKKWTEHFLKLQLRVTEKTPKAPFGWIFWTLLIHIKIFLMWGQAVTVKVSSSISKDVLILSQHANSWMLFGIILTNFPTLKFSGSEIQIQFLGCLGQCLEQYFGQFLGTIFGTVFWTMFGIIFGTFFFTIFLQFFLHFGTIFV